MSSFNNKLLTGFMDQAREDKARFDQVDEPLPPAPVRLKPSDLARFNSRSKPTKGGNGKVIWWAFVIATLLILTQAFVGAYVCPPILK